MKRALSAMVMAKEECACALAAYGTSASRDASMSLSMAVDRAPLDAWACGQTQTQTQQPKEGDLFHAAGGRE